MDSQTRAVTPEELIAEAARIIERNPNDHLTWLMGERNVEAAKRAEAFGVGNLVLANQHDARCNKLADAVRETVKLRQFEVEVQRVLTGRILVALKQADEPVWEATHQHYKGDLYRQTGMRWDANDEELVESVEYDDKTGKKFFISRERWESRTGTGKLRYRPLLEGDDASVLKP